MTNTYTEQAEFWRGDFGAQYIERNAASNRNLANSLIFWSKIVSLMQTNGSLPETVFEVGPNIGINLQCLHQLLNIRAGGIEPNSQAVKALLENKITEPNLTFEGMGQDISLPDASVDFSFSNGVMIHIHPDELDQTCREIHRISKRYILCSEYFSVNDERIPYRGHENRLFKRDFGSHWLSLYPNLKLLDYGFEWKPVTGLDNMTWWLFEKA